MTQMTTSLALVGLSVGLTKAANVTILVWTIPSDLKEYDGPKADHAIFSAGLPTPGLSSWISTESCGPNVGVYGSLESNITQACKAACEFRVRQAPRTPQEAEALSADADVVFVPAFLLNAAIAEAGPEAVRRFVPERRAHRRPVRVLWWREPAWGLPHVTPAIQTEWFDLLMGVHFQSHIVNPSFVPRVSEVLSYWKQPLVPFEQRKRFAVFVSSHCDASPRAPYVAELRKHILIDEFGSCAPESDDAKGELPSAQYDYLAQIKFIKERYKFYLSIENTIQEGYVTEKLLQTPVVAGVVPVYIGAPNVGRLGALSSAARQHPWFVNAFDFDSPKHLAAYLNEVGSNSTQWSTYLRAFEAASADADVRLFPDAPVGVQDATAMRTDLGNPRVQRHCKLNPRKLAAMCALCDLDRLDRLAETAPMTPVQPAVDAATVALPCLLDASGAPCQALREFREYREGRRR